MLTSLQSLQPLAFNSPFRHIHIVISSHQGIERQFLSQRALSPQFCPDIYLFLLIEILLLNSHIFHSSPALLALMRFCVLLVGFSCGCALPIILLYLNCYSIRFLLHRYAFSSQKNTFASHALTNNRQDLWPPQATSIPRESRRGKRTPGERLARNAVTWDI